MFFNEKISKLTTTCTIAFLLFMSGFSDLYAMSNQGIVGSIINLYSF
jgi:hypothetical protein